MGDADAAEGACHVADEAAPVVIVKPVLEVMEAGEVLACAVAAAIAVELYVVKHGLGGPAIAGLIEHAGKGEGGLEEGPAIEAREVDGGGLYVVVDLEGEGLVGGADEGASDGANALADGKVFPVIALGALDQGIEAVAALEDRIEGEAGHGGHGDEDEQESQQANLHGETVAREEERSS